MAKFLYHYVLVTFLAILSSACSGYSRPDAIVTDVDGQPCFAIPENRETRNGIPLYGLLATERKSSDSTSPRSELWSVSVEPAGASIVARPHSCIRYGQAPTGAEAGTAITLLPYRVYTIDLNARAENSNVHSYSAEFCIKVVGGKNLVQVVPWDDKSKQWQYDVCRNF